MEERAEGGNLREESESEREGGARDEPEACTPEIGRRGDQT